MVEIGEVLDKYFSLSIVSPENDLLKYYILNSDGFRHNYDKRISLEFKIKFGVNFPRLDNLEAKGIKMTFEEYRNWFVSFLLQNYYNALENEIIRINLPLISFIVFFLDIALPPAARPVRVVFLRCRNCD